MATTTDIPTSPTASRSVLAVALIVAIGLGVYLDSAHTQARGPRVTAAPRSTVNPNLAPWDELTAIPRVGETVAKRIVSFREAHAEDHAMPAFTQPVDLDAVPGIGVKTVQRMAPYLDFDPRSGGP